MKKLGVKESDIHEKFITGSGKGGQKQNKTASCVYLKHVPSGKEVKCQKSRSREDNRFFARRLLVEELENERLGITSKQAKAIQKKQKQKQKIKIGRAHV